MGCTLRSLQCMAKRPSSAVAAPSISYAGSPFTWYDYFTSVSLSVSNSGGTVTSYAVNSGTLPTGVTLNTSTGAITGTPTALKTAANVVIRATGPGGTSDATINIAVAWFPSSIAGLVAGYDTEAGFSSLKTASDGSGGEAADTDAVGYMSDLSGNGNHVIQATTANKPTLAATGLNSKRCITFDGGDYLRIAAFASGVETQPNTAIVVASLGSVGSDQYFFDAGADGSSDRNAAIIGGNWSIFAGSQIAGDAADTSLHLHAMLFNGASSAMYVDGDLSGSVGNAGSSGLGGLTLGARMSANGNLFSGAKIAVLAFYGADIGSTARANLHTWAQAKWSTPA